MFTWSKKLLLVILLFCSLLTTTRAEDLSYLSTFTATGTSQVFKVLNGGIGTFYLYYVVTGAPASVTIKMEGSADNGSTYSQCGSSGLATSGTNIISCSGTYSHFRVNLSTLSGGTSPTVVYGLFGTGVSTATSINGLFATNTPVSQINPILTGMKDGTSNLTPLRNGAAEFIDNDPQITNLAVVGGYRSYTPAQIGINALALGASATISSTILDTRFVTKMTLWVNCGQITNIQIQPYLEDGTTIDTGITPTIATNITASQYDMITVGSYGGSGQVDFVQGGTAVTTQFTFPQRAIQILITNTTATPTTCTARAIMQYGGA